MQPQDFGIYASGLAHTYGAEPVLTNASLKLMPGELYGLLGKNGAGKSTVIRALCGFMKPNHGKIFVAGVDVTNDPVSVRRQIGVVSEDVDVYEKLTAMEFLVFAGQMHGLATSQAKARAQELLAMLDLAGSADRSIQSFSLGMKKKTAFAAALIHAPRVLFLDEPFNGVDAASNRSLCNLLLRLVSQNGVTIMLTSHVTEMIQRLCTRVEFMDGGRILPEADVRERCSPTLGPDASLDDLLFALSGERAEAPDGLAWYSGR